MKSCLIFSGVVDRGGDTSALWIVASQILPASHVRLDVGNFCLVLRSVMKEAHK
jgi:hypothetical protein